MELNTIHFFFGKKVVILHFGFWSQEAKKSPKEPQEAIMRAINSAFWMELNTTLKKVVGILHFAFHVELNMPYVIIGSKQTCLSIVKYRP
jgi:hypothetical protein